MSSYIGELSAFGTVICWVICSIAFERAGRRIGSMPLNLIRLLIAFVMISLFTKITRGLFFPTDATKETWLWLSLSGVVGFFIGDLCLFRAFVTIGSRVSLLIYSLAPPVSAILGYFMFGESMSLYAVAGMIIIISGISIVLIRKDEKSVVMTHPVKGIILALIGTLAQATGVALSKLGMIANGGTEYNPFASTQIRIIASAICFTMLIVLSGRWSKVTVAFKNRTAMKEIAVGSFFGPFLGVSLSLIAITFTTLGIASTITALLPVAIIVPHVLLYKERISIREVTGAVISVLGVALLFI